MRKKLLSMLVLLTAVTGAWAQSDEVTVTKTAKNTWTMTMPASNVELQVEYETALALSEEKDNTEALTEWDGCEADVTLTRTLWTGGWNTFAVPFNMAIPSGWTVKELSSASFSGGTLTLNFADASSIVAGKPYLVKVSADTYLSAAAITGVTVSGTPVTTETTAVDFIPTLGRTKITDNAKEILFLGASNKLYYPTSLPADMKGFRAYFHLKGDAALVNAFSIDFGDGETTGIKAIDNLTIDNLRFDAVTYTLDGRRIEGQPTQKGVYIVNGKKVIK